jgi:hypothetical protein
MNPRWPKFEDYGDDPDDDNPWVFLICLLLGCAVLTLLAWGAGELVTP